MPQQTTELHLTEPDVMECPYPHYARLFEAGERVVRSDIGVAVLGHEELVQLSKDTRHYSSELAEKPVHMGISPEPIQDDVQAILDELPEVTNALFGADPPEHTRHRKIVGQALNPRRYRQLEPQVQEVTNRLLDGFVEEDTLDFLPRFGIPLPLTVISNILGVYREDMEVFKRWGEEMIAGNSHVLDHPRRLEVARAVVDFHKYFEPLIDERRTQPREDLLSWLVNAEVAGEQSLTQGELGVIVSQILLAGHETTTNLIGNGVVLLGRRPDLRERLRAQPRDIPDFFEEMMRWDGPILCTMRKAKGEVEFHGHRAQDGEWVVPLWGAGSRDPKVFPDPDTFDMDRPNVRNHMGFGHGIHFCVGSELARMEGRSAFHALLTRFGDFEVDEEASDLTHPPTFAQHGYKKIVLRFTRA
ncbi:MAG TPA: cytochrome P450 [Solirubrobacteraceae bacterium]|nr:cytochrome P450 [Solirubrobacteraceae bacterium]